MGIITINCPNCGGHIKLDEIQEKGYCENCGNEIIVQDELNIKNKLIRASDLISQFKFIEAKRILNEILKDKPYNGKAYLYLLLCDLNITHPNQLSKVGKSYINNNNYIRAVQFLDKQSSNELQQLAKINEANIQSQVGQEESTKDVLKELRELSYIPENTFAPFFDGNAIVDENIYFYEHFYKNFKHKLKFHQAYLEYIDSLMKDGFHRPIENEKTCNEIIYTIIYLSPALFGFVSSTFKTESAHFASSFESFLDGDEAKFLIMTSGLEESEANAFRFYVKRVPSLIKYTICKKLFEKYGDKIEQVYYKLNHLTENEIDELPYPFSMIIKKYNNCYKSLREIIDNFDESSAKVYAENINIQ